MNHSAILPKFNITNLNEMQVEAAAAISGPNDVLLISPTGSGKTLAFLLPLLKLLDPVNKNVQALIVVPSRELALQIESVFKRMGTTYKINACYGGHSVRIEENNLTHPPAVLVGTPGRIGHHLRRKNLNLSTTKTLILDEFDKSLELGFKDEMEFIIQQCKHLNKRILTSATALDEIPAFVKLSNSVSLNYTTSHKEMNSALQLKTVKVPGDDKVDALMLLLGKIGNSATIVFCNHREAVDRISEQLKTNGVSHGVYHGGLDQSDREKTLIKLRNGSSQILITTDLASRGLDIPEIKSIVHYQLPLTEETMIHRNGRTARMHAEGIAYFLLDRDDYLPEFLNTTPEEEDLPKKLILPKKGEWATLYISAGKKDKINKMDIVGMLLQKGGLNKDDLGKVDILDHSAYAAIRSEKIMKTLQLVKAEKIKNKKVKIEFAS